MKIGFVVNPIAGAGGRIGLKGSDDVEEAAKRGGISLSPVIAKRFCQGINDGMEILTCSSIMGGDYVNGEIVYEVGKKTTFMDTRKACKEFLKKGAEIIVFVGGDGTARDVYEVTGQKIPMLGIPAGVKMYSSVFAINSERGIKLIHAFMGGKAEVVEREIMDVDEEAFRNDSIKIRLYGMAKSPVLKHYIQNGKKLFSGEENAKDEIAEFMSMICRKGTFIMGPGSTVKAIADKMGLKKTYLGVDVIRDGRIVVKDGGEEEILNAIEGGKARIVVSPIGGENFIFGRGNQQISSRVIKRVGIENVIVVSTPQKMMEASCLYVDTGDAELNKRMAGWINVITGFGTAVRKKVM